VRDGVGWGEGVRGGGVRGGGVRVGWFGGVLPYPPNLLPSSRPKAIKSGEYMCTNAGAAIRGASNDGINKEVARAVCKNRCLQDCAYTIISKKRVCSHGIFVYTTYLVALS
jgi:hypothetical protein